MTHSVATRFSQLFKILSDPYALLILHALFKEDDEMTAEELAEKVNASPSKVKDICMELEKAYVISKELDDGEEEFKAVSSSQGNFLKVVLERIS